MIAIKTENEHEKSEENNSQRQNMRDIS